MDADQSLLRRWGKPVNFGLFGLAAFALIAAGFYFSVFNNGLSPKSDNWSDFGSFVGGLLGPAISIVTLLALLRTIDLQLDQSAHFVADGAKARLAEYKASQLQLLDQQILMYERMIDRYNIEAERVFNIRRETGNTKGNELKDLDDGIQQTEQEVGKLIRLSVDVSLSSFDSIEQLRMKMVNELKIINPIIYKFP
ncbi:hypothetical protein [Pseudomonas sp. TNT3]|uniref:hypothetical protein n=1 Tax=Pseudomonas sp. TNT3 TaxID=2654097 RepID=UPI00139182A8|nr:hypothetical protein [Pseudomonas sp. TNT3]KAI2693104.1 hypothetical protein GBC55_007785 [Pseudomonas sp. TNT3]